MARKGLHRMAKYNGVKSEFQLRSLVFDDYFKGKDISFEEEINKIDFIVTDKKSRGDKNIGARKHYVWMETKKNTTEMYIMLTQLLLTIKTTYDKNEYIIPNYIGCFDTEKIIFVPTNLILDLLHDNDIKWNITASNVKDEYFLKIINKLKYLLHNNPKVKIFSFEKNDIEVKEFIKKNIYTGITENRFEITEHNFDRVYLKWVEKVKPSIAINWEEEKKNGILDGNFFLADLLSKDGLSIKDKLLIVLQEDHYKLTKVLKKSKFLDEDDKYFFKDKQKAYNEFWNIYNRPPLPKYWEEIINRKDLLVPQDIRERKGSYFTPQIWVEKSQDYISEIFGEDWQDKYYVWDCCAGTGNLLVGINRKIENIFASTIDHSDVKAIHDRIDNGARLLKRNVFQFDFLNDSFNKLPKKLKEIIDDPKKRKKLIIYINPPYAEAGNVKQRAGTGKNKEGTSINNKIYNLYNKQLGKASNEIYAQFLIRIYNEIEECKICNFSKLKILHAPNFENFRTVFKAELKKMFIVPADTFDNVDGKFPIGFYIWDLENNNKKFTKITSDIYDKNANKIGKKTFKNIDGKLLLTSFTKSEKNTDYIFIGHFAARGCDFQNQRGVFIDNASDKYSGGGLHINISSRNLIKVSISFTVRKVIEANWINDRDQFFFPNNKWFTDYEFQNNCLIYTIFNVQIKTINDINHWIPYSNDEVRAKKSFKSNFMYNFIMGKIKITNENGLFADEYDIVNTTGKLKFSKEAKDVLDTGKELWKYYHSFPRVSENAGLYDIKGYFQDFKDGRMNNKSKDEEYNLIIDKLRDKIKILAKAIEPKVYEYGFL
jgi:16S rRNA G966 N2-methylase RsmD